MRQAGPGRKSTDNNIEGNPGHPGEGKAGRIVKKAPENKKGRETALRLAVSAGMALIACLLCAFGLFYTPDNRVTDALYQRRGSPSGEIAVIGITPDVLEQLGYPMQWSRSVMARVIRHLNSDPENRPAVIGIDMLFSAESRTDPKGDRELAEACAEYGNVVVAGWANYGTKVVRDADSWALVHGVTGWEEPYDLLRESAVVAHANAATDADRILRHGQLWVRKPDGDRLRLPQPPDFSISVLRRPTPSMRTAGPS